VALSVERGACFSPEEIAILDEALEAALAKLSAREHAEVSRSDLAEHILKLAADGERDPVQLREYALRRTRERAVWLDLAS
jgi:hypothetical protein